MKKRDTTAQSVPGTGGRPKRTLLNVDALAARCHRAHVHPSADLAPFISIAWILQWDLGEDAHVQRVLPDPCVQIVVDAGGAHVMGVVTGSFSVTLTGKRLVLGMKFRPGGFYPFVRQPVASLTDRSVRISHCFPNAGEREPATHAPSNG